MKKTFLKFYVFLNKKEKIKLNFILFITSLSFILEFLSIASIPLFFGLVTKNLLIIENLKEFLSIFNLELVIDNEIIIYIGILIVLIFVSKNILLSFLLIYENKFYENIKNRLSENIYSNFIYAEFENLLDFNPSNISRTIVSVQDVFLYIQSLVGLFKEILAIFAIFLILILVNPQIVMIISLLFSLITYGYFKFLKPFLKKAGEENQNLISNIIKLLNETFGSIKELRILKKEEKIEEIFLRSVKNYNKNFFYYNVIQKFPKILLEVIFLTLLMGITILFLKKDQNFITLMPEIILYAIVSLRFIPAFNSLSTSFTYLKIGEAAVNVIFSDLKRLSLVNKVEKKLISNFAKEKNNNEYLLVENLKFRYPQSPADTIRSINLKIDKGNKIAISGKSGSGKSTLMHLMLSVLKPDSGNIYFKEKSIYDKSINWFNKISYVSQSCYLLDASIESNITFSFDKKIDKQKLTEAIELANLGDFIKCQPSGINTFVGNDGIKISGGERQRIAIARAIYKDSEIIFMDEFSSALDEKNEEIIFLNLLKIFKDKTIILISHRPNIIRYCDKNIILKDGEIEIF